MSWLKQGAESPLFEDILWLKPENPHQRPKVLIVGGSSHGFITTTRLYEAIKSKSAYQTRVILPSSLQKILGQAFDDAVFVDSTPTGEISAKAKTDLRVAMNWAEAIIFSDDVGNNSQTEILLTELLAEVNKPTYFMGHTVELMHRSAQALVENPYVILVCDWAQLSKFNSSTNSHVALLQADGIVKSVDKLQKVSSDWLAIVASNLEAQSVVVESGKVSTTKKTSDDWQVKFVANSVQFAKNFESKRFEILTTAAYL